MLCSYVAFILPKIMNVYFSLSLPHIRPAVTFLIRYQNFAFHTGVPRAAHVILQ